MVIQIGSQKKVSVIILTFLAIKCEFPIEIPILKLDPKVKKNKIKWDPF